MKNSKMAAIEPSAFCLPSFDSPQKKKTREVDADEDSSTIESDAFSVPSFSFDNDVSTLGRPATLLSKRTTDQCRSLSDMVCLLDPDGDDVEVEKIVRRDEDANRNGNIRLKRARDDAENKDDDDRDGEDKDDAVHGRVPDDLNFDAPRKKAKHAKRKLARPRDSMPGYRRNRGGGGRRFGGRGRGGRFRGRGGSNNVGKRHLDRGTTKKAYYRG